LDTATLTLAVVSTFHTALARSADAATKAENKRAMAAKLLLVDDLNGIYMGF
jgi:hypothetical protein